jgi:hypothetical protein
MNMVSIPYVEPMFLYNRQTKHGIDRPFPVSRNFSLHEKSNITDVLKTLIRDLNSTLKQTELVVLDFASFNSDTTIFTSNFDVWWTNNVIIDSRVKKNMTGIRLCPNIAKDQVYCLKIC